MTKILSLPDKQLSYISQEISEAKIILRFKSKSKQGKCPYCGEESKKVHSFYTRKLQDLPIQGKKVKLEMEIKKYFCNNKECKNKTFAETFEFYEPNATKTKRLQEEIIRVSLTQSSVSASKYLRTSVAEVGKSTICNLLKKGRTGCG